MSEYTCADDYRSWDSSIFRNGVTQLTVGEICDELNRKVEIDATSFLSDTMPPQKPKVSECPACGRLRRLASEIGSLVESGVTGASVDAINIRCNMCDGDGNYIDPAFKDALLKGVIDRLDRLEAFAADLAHDLAKKHRIDRPLPF